MSNNCLKILFFPFAAVGHMNPTLGVGQVLRSRGHRVIFAVNDQWSGKLLDFGIEEILLPNDFKAKHLDPSQHFADFMLSTGLISDLAPIQKFKSLCDQLITIQTKICKKLDEQVAILIEQIGPDIIVVDHTYCVPSIQKSGIPWVLICCLNPLAVIDDQRTPPHSSGLSLFDDKNKWKEFIESTEEHKRLVWEPLNDYMICKGAQPLQPYRFFRESQFMNIYNFPQELDYLQIRPLTSNWYRFDNFIPSFFKTAIDIPLDFIQRNGKLIYLSMGSMGGADTQLMKRLVSILEKSEHKFIVSMGPKHDRYQLADNMWGQKSLIQMQVISIVNLVITHGGNNTIAETFYFGKPMIVLPLFGDQYDSAQTIQDKGFGVRLDPYRCTQTQLLNAINMLINNKELNQKLTKISKRIKSENSIAKIPQLFENLVSHK